MSEIKLYIVTDNPERALMSALACGEADRPDWCAVLTDPGLIDRLPDGVRAIGLWYSGRSKSDAERAWRDRRAFGGLSGLSGDDMEWIDNWIEKRNRAELMLALDGLPDRIDKPENARPTDAAPSSSVQHIPDDFRSMALNQRWS